MPPNQEPHVPQDDLQTALQQPVVLTDERELYPGGKKPRRSKAKTIVLIVLALVVLGGGGFAGWWFVLKPKPAAPVSQTPQTTTPTPTTEDTSAPKDVKSYRSLTPRLQVDYPANWPEPTERDNGLTIVSPDLTYETTDKGTVPGNFRIYIRQAAREKDGKYIGGGVVVQPSEKLVYAKPGPGQRKDTNLTNFGAVTSDHFTFFMVTGDYNLKKDEQLGASYGREAETFIITGGWSPKVPTDDLAYSNVPLKNFQTQTAYKQAMAVLKSIQID
jgi:flagellar basal body-associated protein FliL